jgi:hypothetical protein
LGRGDLCVGYRGVDTILYTGPGKPASIKTARSRLSSQLSRDSEESPSEIATFLPSDSNLALHLSFPWAKSVPENLRPSVDEQAVESFFEKFVMYPCNQNSTPGFLEHLPIMFKDFGKEGRIALRWAVKAAAYASLSNEQQNTSYSNKALQYYGSALSKLAESLRDPEIKPDDYVLMTIVILDLFEVYFLPLL